MGTILHSYRFLFRLALLALLTPFLLAACGGGGSSGGSSSGTKAPSSIIGFKLVQTISNVEIIHDTGTATFLKPGDTLTYQFIDQNTILGEGLNTVPTTSWSYSASGNTANVNLNYQGGESRDRLTFSTDRSGSFVSDQHLFSTGAKVRYRGSFRITGADTGGSGGGGSGGSGDDSNQQACETNNTGTVTFYLSNSQANQTVSLSVSGLGSRSTSLFFSNPPTCGATSTGLMTFSNVAASSYSYTAQDVGPTMTWSGNITVPKCGCLLFELR